MNICPKCGTETTGQNFCPHCGADLRGNAATVSRKPGSKAPVIIMSAVVGVLLIAAAVLFVLVLQKPSDKDDHGNASQTTAAATAQPQSEQEQSSVEQQQEPPAEQQQEPPAEEQQPPVENATQFSSVSASSVLPDQTGHNYDPANVLRNDETCWVENAAGYGEGEWIQLNLPEKQRVSGLYLINGYAGSADQYNFNSKISRVQIDFSDGSTTVTDLQVYDRSRRKTIQNIRFSFPVETEYVRLTILGAQAGSCEDTCLTYAAPY